MFGLRLFAIPRINVLAVHQIEVMRRAHDSECAFVHVTCCRIYILNVCVAGYFLKSYEFLGCFRKHRTVASLGCRISVGMYLPFNDGIFKEIIVCGFVISRQLGYDTLTRSHTHTHTHTSHQLKSPAVYRRVYELFRSRTCIWYDT
jgi:hypothetical protein